MKIEQVKKILAGIFETITIKEDEEERIIFKPSAMDKTNKEYPVFKAISDAQHNSGLSYDFSYLVADKAVNILAELENWKDDEAITEAIDACIPVYTYDLMKIYQSNNWAVDEANEEFGISNKGTESQAQMAWYKQISEMVASIKENLKEVIS